MRSRFFLLISTLLAGFGLSAGKAADSFVTPRTGYTQFDLPGLWNLSSNTPRQRSPQYGENTIDYQFTIKDPATFEGKISALVPMTKVGGLVYEYGCHEGNCDRQNNLRGARVEEWLAEGTASSAGA